MLEISLHILDIINNSVKAGASLVELNICEDTEKIRLTVEIIDNGCGMEEDFLRDVTNPFRTTRTTRKVGMGLSLFKAAAEETGGSLSITSKVGEGTRVITDFVYDHIDRQPIGDMAGTITTVLSGNPDIDFLYRHTKDGKEFILDTRRMREILGDDAPLSSPEVILWLTDFINEGLQEISESSK